MLSPAVHGGLVFISPQLGTERPMRDEAAATRFPHEDGDDIVSFSCCSIKKSVSHE